MAVSHFHGHDHHAGVIHGRASPVRPRRANGPASNKATGVLTISLDFELYWGIHDHNKLADCEQRLLGTREVIPAILSRFSRAGVHATWATVGMLFHRDARQLATHRPATLPGYDNPALSPYENVACEANQNESTDPALFAASLVGQIRTTPNQEVGSHTYSHYYCLEPGQSLDAFEADLRQAVAVAASQGIALTSLVFPRNQYAQAHVKVARRVGFKVVRCQQKHWLYRPRRRVDENRTIRLLRLLDSYLPLSGSNVIDPAEVVDDGIVCLPDSRFLRPFSPMLSLLDGLRLRRIKRSMTQAAKSGGIYHLWWHPHNFGTHIERNLAQLDNLLEHYQKLRSQYGFSSLTMTQLSEQLQSRQAAAESTTGQLLPARPSISMAG